MDIVELCGWIGAIMLLVAYSTNLLGNVRNDSPIFLIINIVGSGLLIINAYVNKAYPFIVVNGFWFLVSFYQLIKSRKNSD